MFGNGETEDDESMQKGTSLVSRRRVMRALGATGGAAFFGSFSTSAVASEPPKRSTSVTRIPRDDLPEVAHDTIQKKDIKNIIGQGMENAVEDGTAIQAEGDDLSNIIFTRESSRAEALADYSNLREDELLFSAVRHDLQNGNEMVVAAFASGGKELLVSYSYDRVQDGVQNRAVLYNIVTDTGGKFPKLTPVSRSVNGSEPVPVSEVDTGSVSAQSSDCDDPCGGCYGAPPGDPDHGKFLDASCRESIDLGCVYNNCGTATSCCIGGPVPCAVCLVLFCGGALYTCCPEDPEEQCIDCLSGSDGPCNSI